MHACRWRRGILIPDPLHVYSPHLSCSCACAHAGGCGTSRSSPLPPLNACSSSSSMCPCERPRDILIVFDRVLPCVPLLLTSYVRSGRRLRDILIVFDRLLARGAQKPGSYGALPVLEPGTRVSSGDREERSRRVFHPSIPPLFPHLFPPAPRARPPPCMHAPPTGVHERQGHRHPLRA